MSGASTSASASPSAMTVRVARAADAEAVAEIYNQGIVERLIPENQA